MVEDCGCQGPFWIITCLDVEFLVVMANSIGFRFGGLPKFDVEKQKKTKKEKEKRADVYPISSPA